METWNKSWEIASEQKKIFKVIILCSVNDSMVHEIVIGKQQGESPSLVSGSRSRVCASQHLSLENILEEQRQDRS